ncbi:SPFH domain-containing protein [Duganella phyllosphaerae]|uniref:SPFH domain / band 7 family protein n=1 Tax=Duganella phyllosphaerae TaxID=762836 RepID=A0A1E7X760_9BURK|nr:SPFH domain-containing protein [Duganella phyllosphaerae]OFA08900.1 SPFH domain / band 7 family protein [Duganella phyllosphaerae]
MFQMFGFGGVKCPRCAHKSDDQSGYCNHCGLTLGAPRNEPVLRDNRWVPGDDELAVYFGVSALTGIFTKTLRVPATTRAYILQADKATEVPQGEYEIEGFFTRLNHLLRNQDAEILITRSAALPVEFSFDDLHTAEHLKVSARFTVAIKIENVAAFARHFMTVPGVVSTVHLQELLAPSVRQLAAEFVGSRSMRDMAGNADLRAQLDERLQSALKQRLASYGLAVERVETAALRHDKFDHNRARIGTLWLVADERHVQLEHVKQLDQIYDEEEWQAIWREEQKMRSDFRRAELRQDASVNKAGLTLKESERVQALRAREVELYSQVMEAKTRKVAIDKGAGTVLADLEHELAHKKAGRAGEQADWEHVRHLAQIKMRTELEVLQQTAAEQRQLAQQRLGHQLRQQAIENQIAQALQIEDESHRRNALAALRQREKDEKSRELELEAEAHNARIQGMTVAVAARRREAERVQEWEDQLALARQRELLRGDAVKDAANAVEVAEISQKIEDLRRTGEQADAIAQYEKLLRTIEADGIHARQNQSLGKQAALDQLALDEQRQILRQREREAEWQHELKKLEHERDEKFARWKGDYDVLLSQQSHELSRIEAIGRLSDIGMVATANESNAQAVAQIMRMQIQGGMTPEQIQSLSQVVAAEQGVSPAEAARLAYERVFEERTHRDAELDKDRRHQLDLLNVQNAASASALITQSQLGIGVAGGVAAITGNAHGAWADAGLPPARRCPNGHAQRPGHPEDRFCPQCGAGLA